MEVYSVLITGANKGIGLEFVKQFVSLPKPPSFVFATYRSENSLEALKQIKDSSKESEVILIKMDVNNQEDVKAARKIIENAVGENGLTLLINNAGAVKIQGFPELTEENLLFHFTTNTIGPIRVFQEMLPSLQKASARNSSLGMSASRAAVLNMSSMAGSITRAGVEFVQDLAVPGYKISKAALNMSMRVISALVKKDNILVITMCPGWVKTSMGSERAQITTEESISTMLKTLGNLNESHHALYMDRYGNPYPF